jgi:hypothetical protein
MPTDIRFRRKPARAAEILDDLLASACRGLVAVAISLAILLIVELEIASWCVGEIGQSAQPDLQLMVTSP